MMNENGNPMNLDAEIARLEAVELKLLEVDADALGQDQQNTLAEKLNEVALDLNRLRNADLQNLSDEFKAREPELRARAAQLEQDLSQLNNAVQIIHVAAAGLKTITDIIALLGPIP